MPQSTTTRYRAGLPGVVYLLHFDQPYQHARHYTGWTGDDVPVRLERHATGRGARLMTVIHEAGIGFILVRLCEGTRDTERAAPGALAGGGHGRFRPSGEAGDGAGRGASQSQTQPSGHASPQSRQT